MKSPCSLLCACLASLCFLPVHAVESSSSGVSRVLVVGTIHHRHQTHPHYTPMDLVRILAAFDPQVIGVEIRPQDFRRENYLYEMTLATIWGLDNEKTVVPVDWWNDGNVRAERDSLSRLPEYQAKAAILDSLARTSEIISDFESQYGTWKDWSNQGYAFWNGKPYNDYFAERYRLSMSVYGDSPFNLYYRTRNDSMTALIRNALDRHPGCRMAVFTGAEHKHYFDRALAAMEDVEVVSFESLLPLPDAEPGPGVRAFLGQSDDLAYYRDGYPEDMDAWFRSKMTGLLHGPYMDFEPAVIPEANIRNALGMLERWRQWRGQETDSDTMAFELAWIRFLQKRYREAMHLLMPLAEKIEQGEIAHPFLVSIVHRNLGFCHDCLGEPDKARALYRQGKELTLKTPFAGRADLIYGKILETPFTWEETTLFR